MKRKTVFSTLFLIFGENSIEVFHLFCWLSLVICTFGALFLAPLSKNCQIVLADMSNWRHNWDVVLCGIWSKNWKTLFFFPYLVRKINKKNLPFWGKYFWRKVVFFYKQYKVYCWEFLPKYIHSKRFFSWVLCIVLWDFFCRLSHTLVVDLIKNGRG